MDQKRAIAALGALAQDTRLELFRRLVTSGRMCEGDREERFSFWADNKDQEAI